jgi:hypothetical protein
MSHTLTVRLANRPHGLRIDVEADDTVAVWKLKLFDKEGVPPPFQVLRLAAGRADPLADGESLASLGVPLNADRLFYFNPVLHILSVPPHLLFTEAERETGWHAELESRLTLDAAGLLREAGKVLHQAQYCGGDDGQEGGDRGELDEGGAAAAEGRASPPQQQFSLVVARRGGRELGRPCVLTENEFVSALRLFAAGDATVVTTTDGDEDLGVLGGWSADGGYRGDSGKVPFGSCLIAVFPPLTKSAKKQ